MAADAMTRDPGTGTADFADELTFLVIDDQRSMRRILCRMLDEMGVHHALEAENGDVALELLTKPNAPNVDFIVCDLFMDGMDGLEFCNRLRRDDGLKERHIPILLLTAETDEFVLDIARQVGAADVAHKPISVDDLRVKIQNLLGATLSTSLD